MKIDPEGVMILKETTVFRMNKFRYVCGKNKTKQRHYVIVKGYFNLPKKNIGRDELYVLRTVASKRDNQCIDS